jgi:hypothetical protein
MPWNKQKRAEADKRRYQINKGNAAFVVARAEYSRRWYQANKNHVQTYNKIWCRAQRAEEKVQALALYGPNGEIRCSWPGCIVTDPDMLTFDHVQNDGRARRKMGERGGTTLYGRALKTFIPGLQTLCANHNLKKELMRRRENRGQ